MQIDVSFWVLNIFLLVSLLVITVGYTVAQRGQTHGFPGKLRFTTFSVASFMMVGMLLVGYITFLFLMESSGWTYPITLGPNEYDLANGLWTVLVGAAAGLFLGTLALLKKRELYGK